MKKSLIIKLLCFTIMIAIVFNLASFTIFAELSDINGNTTSNDTTLENEKDDAEDEGVIDYSNPVSVSSADELELALNEAASAILIAADFELDRTFYVISDTVIVANEPHTLKRASTFGADIFVVGENSDGTATLEPVTLTIGKPDDTTPSMIVFDGNSSEMATDVVGTVILVRGESSANLYHNVTMTDHVKVGNQKTLTGDYGVSYPLRVGGAVAIVSSKATMQIYGGLYTKNRVNDIVDSSTDEGNTSSQGGVIYNYGTLSIFGGVFSYNHAGRGGVFYNYRTMNIYNADINNNTASSLGGAIYVPNSTAAFLYIGEENDKVESDVRFANNVSESAGGAIYAQNVLIVKNTKFIGNSSISGNGGAISAGAMQLSIEDSNFTENQANGGYGGAIYISGNNGDEDVRELIVSNTTLENNSSKRGGAVYMSEAARAYFSNVDFIGNASTGYGGAIHATNSTLEINDASINGNTAATNGGAISLYSSSKAVMNNITTDANQGSLGGFVYINGASLDLFNSDISNNVSTNNGGAVYAYTNAIFNAYNTVFENNSCAANGGAVMIYNGGVNSILHSCTFNANKANGVGGALYISNKSQVELYNIIATNNTAPKGGFMYETTSGTVVTLVGLTVSGNTASEGGAIIWGNTVNAKLYIDKIKYVDNDYNGDWNDEYWASAIYNLLKVYDTTGTIPSYEDYNGQTIEPAAPVSITNVSTAAQLERALQVGYAYIRITADFEIDRTFYVLTSTTIFADTAHVLTRASNFGADIFVVGEDASGNQPDKEVIFSIGKKDGTDASLTIDGNSSAMTVDVVGTVVFVCDGATVNLNETLTITNNKKVGNDRTNNGARVSYSQRVGGAAVIIEGGAELNVYGGTYSNNVTNDITDANTDEGSLSSHGGAFYNYGTMNVYDGTFSNNHAGRGGAFYNYRTLNIYSANIIGNTASTYGGAIYMPNSTAAFLYIGELTDIVENGKVYFTNNTAVDGGGALYARNLISIKNAVFESNFTTGGYGGAIYAATTRMTIDNTEFKKNSASSYGAAIYLTGKNEREETLELTVNNSTFEENFATSRAGAVYMSGSSRAYFYNTDFKNNSSATGGVFYINGANLEINTSEILSNKASNDGGVIALYASSKALFNNLTVRDNSTDAIGGFAYAEASEISVYNSSFIGNTSVKNSGVAYMNTNSVLNAYNTIFKDNHSGANGGALTIYTAGTDSIIHSCTFENNKADNAGGALYISNKSQVAMYNTVATANTADKGGFMYETTSGTVVTVVGLTVSDNTATSGGPIIWGNTTNAKMYIDKSKYTDLNATGALDDAYWKSAIYNKLTYSDKAGEIPKYLDYGNEAYDHMSDAIDVTNSDELESAILAGFKHIRITADFILDRTFYITEDVTIFSTITHVLTRASDFGGDIFVVGENASGKSSLLMGHNAKLTLGNPLSTQNDLLIIDGNDSEMTVDVVGSVLFICQSAIVNLHTNLTVQNCRKVNNERTYEERYNLSIPNRIGATLAVIASGTLNIHGGNYKNNTVNEEIDSSENGRISSVGGLIFNYSNLNIYGGTFENNTAARGAVIYSYRITRIFGGSFIGNNATVSGGVYYAPNSAQIHLYVGSADAVSETVLFKENTAKSSGGVIYGATLTANVIYGNASFVGNSVTNGSGGAICMYGQLTVRNSYFEGNTASNRGGAIYASNSSLEDVTRFIELTNCTFKNNVATLGGAISLFAGGADFPEGAIANVTDCEFIENHASLEISGASTAAGGAIYLDRKSYLNLTNSKFSNNKADTEAGAIYVAGESTVKITNCDVSENTSGKYGGAISVRSSYLDITDTDFIKNESNNNGGAIYVSYQSNREINSKVTITSSRFDTNHSKTNGGAIYATRRNITDTWNILTVIDTVFDGNTAEKNGGAIYALANVGIYIENATFSNNSATTDSNGSGGAIYAAGSKIEINTASFDGNTSSDVGGALFLDSSASVIMNKVTVTANTAYNGGFLYMVGGSSLNLYNSTISNNTSTNSGGAIYSNTNTSINAYNTEFIGNTAGENGGAIMVYNGGSDALLHSCKFEGNSAVNVGGALYVSNKSQLSIYNAIATANTANKGGFMYETTSGTIVNIAGLSVSKNNASSGGNIIWGNTVNAKLFIDKSQYTDLDITTELDDAYWSEAIYNALTVQEKALSIPDYDEYVHEEPKAEESVKKPVVSVDHIFELAQNSNNGYINATYDKLPILNNSSNFMSDGTTYFENINGKTVSVDSFIYDTYAKDGNVNVGQGILIYQAMLYKQAHPDEEVSISVSSYRLSIAAAVNINRNSRYFGYMRNLYGRDYDEFGFVRISYLLVSAAKMGVKVTVIGHIDAYPVNDADPNLYEYFTGHLDTPCDPAYSEGVVGDHLNFAQSYWSLTGKGGTDMMHTKLCAVSHYLDMNGVEHKNAVFTSSANLDGITSGAYNGNWKLQTATIVSDHEYIYQVSVNYLNLIAEYSAQEKIYEFQDIMSTVGAQQIDLILAGKMNEIPKEELLVYLGTENDDVFELYFTPFAGGTTVWDETYNPYTKYIREMYNSEGSIIFIWNAAEYNSQFPLGFQIEEIVSAAFHNNKNPENKFFGNMEGFNTSLMNGLVVGKDIGYLSINQYPYGEVHNKDILMSYVKNGQRYYVSLLNSCNMHAGSMCYQSNFMLVIKETDCEEDSVFFNMADLSTTGIVEHTYGEEQSYIPEDNSHGYYYTPCIYCDKQIITGTIHRPSDWITDKDPQLNINGIKHKECTVCNSILEVKEIIVEESEYEAIIPDLEGMEFNSNNLVATGVTTTPLTFEAVIQLSKQFTDRGGVIISNYDGIGGKNQISLEIYTYGRVRLYTKSNGITNECFFDVDIRSDSPVHITVTVDGRLASLFVDGVLADTKTLGGDMPTITEPLTVGGDARISNYQYFKGIIYSVSVFEDVRTAAEITKDMLHVSADTQGLLYSRVLATEKIPTHKVNESGKVFTENNSIAIDTLPKTPTTIEAIVHIPLNRTGRIGTIFGNYDGSTQNQLNLEIYENGAPRLYINRQGVASTYLFDADIRSNSPVHIAVTISGTLASLYVNGELADTASLTFELPAVNKNFKVGGDNRDGNAQYFKGTLYALGLYGNVRTAEQIKQDAILMDSSSDELLYLCYYEQNTAGESNTSVGATFNPNNAFDVGTLTASPHTFEAIIRFLPDIYERAGVIVGNYDNGDGPQINLELFYDGNVRLFYFDGVTRGDCIFQNVDVRSNTAKHIAVTVEDTKASLYVDGILVETKSIMIKLPETTENFKVGGDNRLDNTQYFKGEIFAVYMFSDVRTPEEILNDYRSGVNNDESIIYSGDFTKTPTDTTKFPEYRPIGQIFNESYLDFIEGINKSPLTFEATVQVPTNITDRAGVIVGNYRADHSDQISIEIYYNGRVRLFFVNNERRIDTVFNTDIRSDAPVHIALTVDGTLVTLYVNGTKTEEAQLPIPIPEITSDYAIGGDFRPKNDQYFKGKIYNVALFNSVRTAEDIKHDASFISKNSKNLMYLVQYAGRLCSPYTDGISHLESSWIVDREPTELVNGLSHKECIVCGTVLARHEISNTRKDGENIEFSRTDGLVINSANDAVNIGNLNSAPMTFEALIQLNPSYSNRAGVILGSYDGTNADGINIEIYTNGNPRLYYKVGEIGYSYVFTTDIRSEAITHIAITLDGLTACLYVNGTLVEKVTLKAAVPSVTEDFYIGNDARNSEQYFKGIIYGVAIFDDIRTADEIAIDALLVSENAEGLIYSNYFTKKQLFN